MNDASGIKRTAEIVFGHTVAVENRQSKTGRGASLRQPTFNRAAKDRNIERVLKESKSCITQWEKFSKFYKKYSGYNIMRQSNHYSITKCKYITVRQQKS